MIRLFKIGGCSMDLKQPTTKGQLIAVTQRERLMLIKIRRSVEFKLIAYFIGLEYRTFMNKLNDSRFEPNEVSKINRYLESIGIKDRV